MEVCGEACHSASVTCRQFDRPDKIMRPKDVVKAWVEAFNRGDPDQMAGFYEDDAVNHQVTREPVLGRAAIREMFAQDFAEAEMVCIAENIFEDGDWAILEWRDPLGLRGCGFFQYRTARSFFSGGIGTSCRSSNNMACPWSEPTQPRGRGSAESAVASAERSSLSDVAVQVVVRPKEPRKVGRQGILVCKAVKFSFVNVRLSWALRLQFLACHLESRWHVLNEALTDRM